MQENEKRGKTDEAILQVCEAISAVFYIGSDYDDGRGGRGGGIAAADGKYH